MSDRGNITIVDAQNYTNQSIDGFYHNTTKGDTTIILEIQYDDGSINTSILPTQNVSSNDMYWF